MLRPPGNVRRPCRKCGRTTVLYSSVFTYQLPGSARSAAPPTLTPNGSALPSWHGYRGRADLSEQLPRSVGLPAARGL